MKASELVALLQRAIAEKGDNVVMVMEGEDELGETFKEMAGVVHYNAKQTADDTGRFYVVPQRHVEKFAEETGWDVTQYTGTEEVWAEAIDLEPDTDA